jgi:hypothetical protein
VVPSDAVRVNGPPIVTDWEAAGTGGVTIVSMAATRMLLSLTTREKTTRWQACPLARMHHSFACAMHNRMHFFEMDTTL